MDKLELRDQLERHHAASQGWALACCAHDPAEAEDVLQEVYLKVLDGRAAYHGQASFRTWLFAVIRKTAAAQRRRNWFRQLWLIRYSARGESADPARAPDELAEQSQQRAMLLASLSHLPRRQREVLHLVFYHDPSRSEAAAAMGVSIGSARTHYDRAKQALRERVRHQRIFHETGITRREPQDAVP